MPGSPAGRRITPEAALAGPPEATLPGSPVGQRIAPETGLPRLDGGPWLYAGSHRFRLPGNHLARLAGLLAGRIYMSGAALLGSPEAALLGEASRHAGVSRRKPPCSASRYTGVSRRKPLVGPLWSFSSKTPTPFENRLTGMMKLEAEATLLGEPARRRITPEATLLGSPACRAGSHLAQRAGAPEYHAGSHLLAPCGHFLNDPPLKID